MDTQSQTKAATSLQPLLVGLIDLALQLKQAHWNVTGPQFQSVHERLDVVLDDVRIASDEIAERIVTLGVPADGRSSTVAEHTTLPAYPDTHVDALRTVELCAERLRTVVAQARAAQAQLADVDPVSEDLVIGQLGALEKHLWMLSAHLMQDA